ncbi:MAG: metallophosphoesterase [Desulfocapsaceae bacterium]|nr:metallophosphoesterase [Desulfocapsaceae bacterium]
MKILSVADKVAPELLDDQELRERCSDLDLIVSCGDLPPEYLTTLRHQLDVPLLYILGNHDLRYASSPPHGCQCIDGKIVTIDNCSIAGFSGSRWYNGGMNQYTEKQMSKTIARLRFSLWRNGSPDLVITHAPPRHIHDAEDPCHKGFRSYIKFIEKYQPAYFIHGHIHKQFADDQERITAYNSTKIINAYGFYFFET